MEKLIKAHNDKTTSICALRMHEMVLGYDGEIVPYKEWHYCVDKCSKDNNLAFFTSGGGVLFPPHCFSDEVFNKDVFMEICNSADDVWFNAMRLLNDIEVSKVFSPNPEADYYITLNSNIDSLDSINWLKSENDKAIKSVFGYYNLFDKIRKK